MKSFDANAQADRALMCRMSGCRNRWTVDMGHGKVCSHHDETLSRAGSTAPPRQVARFQEPIPLRDAVRPFSELADCDEEAF